MTALPKPVRLRKERKMLQRRAKIRARGKTKHARRERDFEYMARIAQQACIARLLNATGNTCAGSVQVHHAFWRRGADSDRKTIPLCRHHHECWHQHKGEFYTWDRERRHMWSLWAIEYARLEAAGGGGI